METVYHSGEIEAQEYANERNIAERNGKVLIDKIIPGAVNFIEKQPFVIASSMNKSGEITTSVLAGLGGFIKVKSENTVVLDPTLLISNPADQFWENIHLCKQSGLLFIEPQTRRRFRLNGRIEGIADKIDIIVEQAYPNCPKYIQQKSFSITEKPSYHSLPQGGVALTPEVSAMISEADTLFVGSSDLNGHMDASHRGGSPGFILIKDAHTLIIPDYPGNSMFNTLGNFLVNPKAGILIFHTGLQKTLQLTGSVKVSWNAPEPGINTAGTNRFWTFSLARWRLMENLKGFETRFISYSPFNPS